MQTAAAYFDGESAGSVPVALSLQGYNLVFATGTQNHVLNIQDISLIPPVGEGTWNIELEDGASIRFANDSFAKELSSLRGDGGILRRLEGAWHWALIALVVAIASTWALLTVGVPVAAKYAAFAMPQDLNNVLGEDSLVLMDRLLFDPSELPDESKQRVQRLFSEILDKDDAYSDFRLEFRTSDMGANAFAVPGGIVVMTDEMVNIAASDDELSAVLAHEVGHLHNRHSLRIILQDSTSALIIASITGDLTSLTALSATVPTVLMQAKYSRDFEREADEFAFQYLESRGVSVDVLSQLLLRIEDESGGAGVPDWMSSHPQSNERVPED